jgi:mannose PTS system EIIC component
VSEWLLLLLLGGFVGLDATAFPQVMISRPLVAGTLAGMIFGQPAAGALVGGLLEVFHLSILPIGAARYPEAGVAAVAASAAYVNANSLPVDPAALLLALLVALVWERVAGSSAIRLRRVNERFAVVDPAAAPTPRSVQAQHVFCIGLDFARGAAVSGLGAALGMFTVRGGAGLWTGPPLLALVALSAAASAAIGSGLSVFGGWQERRVHFLAGALVGLLLLMIR